MGTLFPDFFFRMLATFCQNHWIQKPSRFLYLKCYYSISLWHEACCKSDDNLIFSLIICVLFFLDAQMIFFFPVIFLEYILISIWLSILRYTICSFNMRFQIFSSLGKFPWIVFRILFLLWFWSSRNPLNRMLALLCPSSVFVTFKSLWSLCTFLFHFKIFPTFQYLLGLFFLAFLLV